jgi:hypothetical protein
MRFRQPVPKVIANLLTQKGYGEDFPKGMDNEGVELCFYPFRDYVEFHGQFGLIARVVLRVSTKSLVDEVLAEYEKGLNHEEI